MEIVIAIAVIAIIFSVPFIYDYTHGFKLKGWLQGFFAKSKNEQQSEKPSPPEEVPVVTGGSPGTADPYPNPNAATGTLDDQQTDAYFSIRCMVGGKQSSHGVIKKFPYTIGRDSGDIYNDFPLQNEYVSRKQIEITMPSLTGFARIENVGGGGAQWRA